MSASNFLENKLLDNALGVANYSTPTPYLALFTSDPGEDGTGTEVSGGSYVREAITFNPATNGTSSNNGVVQFDTATANWGTVSHVAVFDASTGGNMLFYGAVTVSKTITTGDTFQVGDENLTITLD